MDDFTEQLLTGLARDLAIAGIGTWSSTGVYGNNVTGIVLGRYPDKPDNIIALTAYGVTDAPGDSDHTIGVQVRTRRGGQDPRPGMSTADRIFDRWHGRTTFVLPGDVSVTQMTRRSWTSGGIDTGSRLSTIQNFYVQLVRPSQHRP